MGALVPPGGVEGKHRDSSKKLEKAGLTQQVLLLLPPRIAAASFSSSPPTPLLVREITNTIKEIG